MGNEKLEHCKKIVSAIYLACDEGPAKDISEHLQWLIGEFERVEGELAAMKEKFLACESQLLANGAGF